MAEVIEPGESVTPAPGLLKKGGKDEKPPLNVATTLILSLTITGFYPLLNKAKGSEVHPYFGFSSPSFDFSSGLLYNKNS